MSHLICLLLDIQFYVISHPTHAWPCYFLTWGGVACYVLSWRMVLNISEREYSYIRIFKYLNKWIVSCLAWDCLAWAYIVLDTRLYSLLICNHYSLDGCVCYSHARFCLLFVLFLIGIFVRMNNFLLFYCLFATITFIYSVGI